MLRRLLVLLQRVFYTPKNKHLEDEGKNVLNVQIKQNAVCVNLCKM